MKVYDTIKAGEIMKKRELVLVVAIIALDLLSKAYIDNVFYLGESLKIINNFFYITYIHNTGAAWGMFPNLTWFFNIVSILGTIFFLIWLFKTPQEKKLYRYCISIMLAGTIGNLYDRFFLHYVRDFLDFKIFGYDFPVFNIADSALTIGVIGLLLLALLLPGELSDE